MFYIKKSLPILLLSVLLLLSVVGCASKAKTNTTGNDTTLTGDWVGTAGNYVGSDSAIVTLTDQESAAVTLHIDADSTFTFVFLGETYKGSYKVNDETQGTYDLTLDGKDTATGTWKFSNGTVLLNLQLDTASPNIAFKKS